VIQHTTPNEARPVEGKVNIAVVAWETTRIPQYWVDKLNKFDAVITFCDASVEAFRDCGVTVPIHKVPHTFDIPSYTLDDVEAIKAPSSPDFFKDRFVFYNISQFSAKKGIDVLLRSYYGAFHGMGDKVLLVFKTYIDMSNRTAEQKKLQEYIEGVKRSMRLPPEGYPPIMLVTKTLTEKQMRKIHKTGHCYVCSSRGEGWCIPAFEALAYGNMLVTTVWGGMGEFAAIDNEAIRREYLIKNNVYSVDYHMEPLVGQTHADPDLYTGFDLVAEPSVSSMMDAMKMAYGDKEPESPPDLMEFDHSTVGPKMKEVIEAVASNKMEESNV
jgi:glycosyltransferase involved in cell wall biosynthesis